MPLYRCDCGAEYTALSCEATRGLVCPSCSEPFGCHPVDQLPPVAVQAGNAARAVARVMAAGARGEAALVGRDEKQTRREVCGLCPANVGGRCADCGCWIRAKSLLATEDCPRALWPARISAHGSTETEPARVERGAPEAGGSGRGV